MCGLPIFIFELSGEFAAFFCLLGICNWENFANRASRANVRVMFKKTAQHKSRPLLHHSSAIPFSCQGCQTRPHRSPQFSASTFESRSRGQDPTKTLLRARLTRVIVVHIFAGPKSKQILPRQSKWSGYRIASNYVCRKKIGGFWDDHWKGAGQTRIFCFANIARCRRLWTVSNVRKMSKLHHQRSLKWRPEADRLRRSTAEKCHKRWWSDEKRERSI